MNGFTNGVALDPVFPMIPSMVLPKSFNNSGVPIPFAQNNPDLQLWQNSLYPPQLAAAMAAHGTANYSIPGYNLQMPLMPSLDLNKDPKVHAQMTNYFYFKTIDKWLYDDLLSLLNYVKVSNGRASLISNLHDKSGNTDKDSQETIETKIKFIEEEILSDDNMYKILKKFIRETGVQWYELEKNQSMVKSFIKRYVKKKLERMVEAK